MGVTAVVGGAVVGGIIQGNAAQNAASTEAAAANNASQVQMNMFNTEQNNLAPYRAAGEGALTQLQGAMPDLTRDFTMNDFHQDPGYQFQLQQGQQAVQNSAAARGLLNSSAAMKNIDSYTQGMANTDYQQARNNFTQNQQQRYNMMAGLASSGQGAVNSINSAGQNAANNIGNNMMSAGNAAAAAQVGTANAITGTLNQGMNSWMQSQYLDKMNPSIYGQQVPYSAPAQGAQIMSGGDNINMTQLTG